MRRILILMLTIFLMGVPGALAEQADMPWDIILEAVAALNPDGLTQNAEFVQAGTWMSVTVSQEGFIAPRMQGVQYYGLVFALPEGERIAWEDVFIDGDAAAARMEEIASASLHFNTYSEYNEVSPVPRESFTVQDGVLTVYYPATQLSCFSGRSGGLSFYAYELDGLLAPDVPLHAGDPAQAGSALNQALESAALPGPLSAWAIGRPMQEAADALGLVDVPDFDEHYAQWMFEAPQMRGVTLLSAREMDQVETAVISGIRTTRIDFSGLQTGISTREACLAALPDGAEAGEDANGDTLSWQEGNIRLVLHFVDDVLHQVSLLQV